MNGNLLLFSKLFVFFYFSFLGFSGSWFSNPIVPLAVAIGVLVLLSNRQVYFNVFMLLHVLDAGYRLPFIPNVIFLSAVTSSAFLAIQLHNYVWHRRSYLDRSLAQFSGVLLLNLAALYFWTVFNKLNVDFLTPAVSCATFLLNKSIRISAFIHDEGTLTLVYRAAIFATLVFEALIPILLLTRRYRVVGILVGFVFHLGLAVTHFDFTAAMTAFYAFLLPPRLADRLVAAATGPPRVILAVQVVGVAMVLVVAALSRRLPYLQSFNVAFGAWTLCTAAVVFVMVRARIWTFLGEAAPRGEWKYWQLLFPAAVLANGLMPYVGLKTDYSLSMYSNLRTEGGRTNHLLVTAPFYLADFQNDIVFITETEIDALRQFRGGGLALTYFEFNRVIQQQLRAGAYRQRLTFRRHDREYHVTDLRDLEMAGRPNPLWLNKLFRFRDVQLGERVACVH